MPRMARLKFYDPEEGYYHIISRTVLKSFLLEEVVAGLFRQGSRIYNYEQSCTSHLSDDTR